MGWQNEQTEKRLPRPFIFIPFWKGSLVGDMVFGQSWNKRAATCWFNCNCMGREESEQDFKWGQWIVSNLIHIIHCHYGPRQAWLTETLQTACPLRKMVYTTFETEKSMCEYVHKPYSFVSFKVFFTNGILCFHSVYPMRFLYNDSITLQTAITHSPHRC